ncbi:hypothetical protein EsH8_V_000738 [Colletotrichum jinshuiense]
MSMTRDQLEHLTETDVRNPIPADVLLPALNSPPFVPSTSLINIRDLGIVPGSSIRPGLVYRCGTLEVTANDPKALNWLAAHVKHIFDIRSPMERKKAPDPEVKGVVNTWLDSTVVDPKPNLDDFVEGGGEAGVRKEYLKILDIYRPSFRAILEHVRDKPGEAFLFHCTAGRDRTGVMAGLLQSLAGAEPEDVRFDYMLSRIGTETARERLLRYARIGTGITTDNNPGFNNLCSLRTSCWDAFVAGVQEKHGGWEGYVTGTLGFSDDDLGKIKTNLRPTASVRVRLHFQFPGHFVVNVPFHETPDILGKPKTKDLTKVKMKLQALASLAVALATLATGVEAGDPKKSSPPNWFKIHQEKFVDWEKWPKHDKGTLQIERLPKCISDCAVQLNPAHPKNHDPKHGPPVFDVLTITRREFCNPLLGSDTWIQDDLGPCAVHHCRHEPQLDKFQEWYSGWLETLCKRPGT